MHTGKIFFFSWYVIQPYVFFFKCSITFFRYVLSVGVIVGVYMLVQIILSIVSFVVRSYFVNKLHIMWYLFSDVVSCSVVISSSCSNFLHVIIR